MRKRQRSRPRRARSLERTSLSASQWPNPPGCPPARSAAACARPERIAQPASARFNPDPCARAARHASVELLEDARDAGHEGRAHGDEVLFDLRRPARERRDVAGLEADPDRLAGQDVRQRKKQILLVAFVDPHGAHGAADRRGEVLVREHHPLGGPGGARGVDDGEQRLGADRLGVRRQQICAAPAPLCASSQRRPSSRSAASERTASPDGSSSAICTIPVTVNSRSRSGSTLSRWATSSTITIFAPASRMMNSHCSAVFDA